jgi:hypothetical protein
MLNIKFRGIGQAERATREKIKRAIKDPRFLNQAGDLTLKAMKTSLNQGKDPSTRKKHSANLKKSTINRRNELKKSNSVSSNYKDNKALVFTGQLINSLAFKISRSSPLIFFLAQGTHEPYRSKSGKPVGKKISNRELVGYLQKKRTVIGLHKETLRTIAVRLRSTLRKIL